LFVTTDRDLALELGEHAEHLDQHAPDRRARVERFGGGPADSRDLLTWIQAPKRRSRSVPPERPAVGPDLHGRQRVEIAPALIHGVGTVHPLLLGHRQRRLRIGGRSRVAT
jgi:hypothetical protein